MSPDEGDGPESRGPEDPQIRFAYYPPYPMPPALASGDKGDIIRTVA